jgi:hypothetical protein
VPLPFFEPPFTVQTIFRPEAPHAGDRTAAGACLRGIREFCLSRGARVFMRQARRRSCSPCCRPALREPGCRTLAQIARAGVGLDRTGMPSCPGAANETSPPRPSFPEGSILPPPLGQIGVAFHRNKAATSGHDEGHAAVAPPSSAMNSRRLIRSPRRRGREALLAHPDRAPSRS